MRTHFHCAKAQLRYRGKTCRQKEKSPVEVTDVREASLMMDIEDRRSSAKEGLLIDLHYLMRKTQHAWQNAVPRGVI
jgi:hypothetical protein